jgi:hypothetical protein
VSTSEILFYLGGFPFGFLGAAHLTLTVRDMWRPRHWVPTDQSLVPAMQRTNVVATRAPMGRSMWRNWLGIHVSHGIGLLVFSSLPILVALHDYALVSEIPGFRLAILLAAFLYAVNAIRNFFLPPFVFASVGIGLFVASALTG